MPRSRQFSALAEQGSRKANIALVRIQHCCGSVAGGRRPDVNAQISKLSPDLPPDKAARVAGVIQAEADYMNRARAACRKATFDYRRYRSAAARAAEAGDPASATELAQFMRDPAKKKALLKAAADKNIRPRCTPLRPSCWSPCSAARRPRTSARFASCSSRRAARCRKPRWIWRIAWRWAATDIRPMRSLPAPSASMLRATASPMAFCSMVRMPWGSTHVARAAAGLAVLRRSTQRSRLHGRQLHRRCDQLRADDRDAREESGPAVAGSRHKLAEELWRDNEARAKKENNCS